jgi:hypothetical protein
MGTGSGSKGIDGRYRVEFAQEGKGFICIDLSNGETVKQGNIDEVTDFLDHQENIKRVEEKTQRRRPPLLKKWFGATKVFTLAASLVISLIQF